VPELPFSGNFASSVPRLSTLTLQNIGALLLSPLYLLARPLLRLFGLLGPRVDVDAPWVIGGHSGRVYTDNAAALHALLVALGRPVIWIASDRALLRSLRARGVRVLRRNSWQARLALERAPVLIYSHGISDLDHVLPRVLRLRGLKIHLNHSLNQLKMPRRPPPASLSKMQQKSASRIDQFDYLLASSERERLNFLQSFPGAEERIVLGGGAHLDPYMHARTRAPGRSLVYFPTFRETKAASMRLEGQIAQLSQHPKLRAWLAQEDYQLLIVSHVNRPARAHDEPQLPDAHVRIVDPADVLTSVLQAALLISDYSGILCDFLVLDRPTIFFAFDKADYLEVRSLYVDYDAFAYGPQAGTVDQLVELIVSGEFRNTAAYEATRRRWQAEFFPVLEPVYTRATQHTIDKLLAAHNAAAAAP
jgi:CDP-glycerol glycerophosphotransferase